MDRTFLDGFGERLAALSSEKPAPLDLHNAIGGAVMAHIASEWRACENAKRAKKRAAYLSAEFLVGRAVYNNLMNLGVTEDVRACFEKCGLDFYAMERVPDPALGNGGLGRLAACYLDSAAAMGVPLDGYGIRYRYGLFRQSFEGGFQQESADNWYSDADPWSVRREKDAVEVAFAGQRVKAVPYDMPIIGYGGKIGRLRLWQAEAMEEFDFGKYKQDGMSKAFSAGVAAAEVSALLYPDDSTRAGKTLRLKQQYFFCNASLQDMCRDYEKNHGTDFDHFPDYYAIQLNDTHPALAIPDLIRILMNRYGCPFEDAFNIARRTFAYTNHTVMPEALEKWNSQLLRFVLPDIYDILIRIDKRLWEELASEGLRRGEQREYRILCGGQAHMARLAVYASSHTNGVSEIHTQILKDDVLTLWHKRYPDRFLNVTNGVTQRRWLKLCNPGLSGLISELLGGDEWITDLSRIGELKKFVGDASAIERFEQIKRQNKDALCKYLKEKCGIRLDGAMLLDAQIKRVHEYKRQLLNAFGILELYFALKEGELPDFQPTAFLFGGKAAPGYVRAKGVIKFINSIAAKINSDKSVSKLMQVYFVPDYNVSAAEKIIPAAELSEQISTAGTEASGTGNMKLSLNGAITIGTYDGANIEIFRDAGIENNFVFGARVEDIAAMRDTYDPESIYKKNKRARRAIDCLVSGEFDDGGSGVFRELHRSLLEGAVWHEPDHYYLLHDFDSYNKCRYEAVKSYADKSGFYRKAFLNAAGCGRFSSDYSVVEYARKIWGIEGSCV